MSDDAISAFLKTLVPQPYDRTVVSERKGEIEKALGGSSLNVAYMFEGGSWSQGTAVAGHSDVDYMAWAVGNRPALPSSALSALKSAIKGSHWAISSVSVSSPTAKVAFYSQPDFEVVPAWMSRKVGDDVVFHIPGPGDMWIESVPAAHNRYVREANDRLGKKVKPLARLLKAWKYHTGAPVSSFYLEMRTAAYANSQDSIYFHPDLMLLMHSIIKSEMAAMNDPLGIVSRIPATSSEEKRRATIRLLEAAVSNLHAAYKAQENQDSAAYWIKMSNVFGTKFPFPRW